jgi:peptidase M28-like protein/PDZ domain-containing protein
MIAITLAAFAALQTATTDSLSPAARRVQTDVRWLAEDAREGRGLKTAGLQAAGDYIADAWKRAGVRPGGKDGTFFQPFTLSADAPGVMHTDLGGAETRNVVGVIPGTDPARRGQVVVVGAHYDHLGLGGANALDPDSTGKVHNGADDNASGTAALLEIARQLAGRRLARTVVLVAFSAEEVGAIGSSYYVRNPLGQPADSIYAMLNLDMVGRLRGEKLLAFGAATATEFPALLDSLNKTRAGGFDLRASGDGWGPSDHASFYAAKRPVLHFFTDTHEQYHRSTDDWGLINNAGLARVAGYVADLATALANRFGTLTFVDAPRPTVSASGSNASLGTIPDMSESPGGVKIAGVRAEGPAAVVGMQKDDVITKIGEHVIANLYDMTNALRAHKPGDTVVVVFKRGEVEHKVTAVLGRRGG